MMIDIPPVKDEQLLYRLARLNEQNEDFQYFLKWLKDSGDRLRDIASEPAEFEKFGEKNAYSGAAQYNGLIVEQINNARESYEQIKQSKK